MRRNRSNRTRRPLDRATAGSTAIVRAVRELATLTQTRSLPSKRDKEPFPTPARPPIHTFRRTYTAGQVTASNTVNSGALAFTLDSLPGYTEFTSLFDQYRITEALVKFVPLTLEFGPSTNPSVNFPVVYTVIDLDDNVTPVTTDELKQYDTCQVISNQNYFTRCVQPRAALAAYSGAFTSYSQAPVSQWMDVASPSIQYYGVKWACSFAGDLSNPATYKLYNIEVSLTVQLRSSR